MGPQDWTQIVPTISGKPGSGCEFIGGDGTSANPGAPSLKCLEAVFANVLSAVVTLAGIALFVMLTIGALRFLTAGGDPKAAEAAQKTMTSAVLGLALIIGSYLILRLISAFTGIELFTFEIPFFD